MQMTIQKAVDEAASQWIDIDGIEAVGQGELEGKECIMVYVSASPDELSAVIPTTFEEFPVVVEESGIINAQ